MICRALILAVAMLAVAAPVHAQSERYKVFDTRPVITEGLYLVATGETTATIVWLTDTPSHAKVRYGPDGDLSAVAEPQVDGLVPVGTRHVVPLRDLSPGTTYSYQVVATRVVKLRAYWPDKGLDVRSGPHPFRTHTPPGPDVQHDYHLLVVGQKEVARVDATSSELKVVVTDLDGSVVHTLEIPRRPWRTS